jgi:hypothetical protein
MHAVSRSLLVMLLGAATLALPFACGSGSSAGTSAGTGDDDADDDSTKSDDDTSADDDGSGDDAGAADDDTGDDDTTGDDDSSTSTFETDAGTYQVVFSGEGDTCGDEVCKNATLNDGATQFQFSGCCADEAASRCGLDFKLYGLFFGLKNPGCEALDLPGSPDSSCESSAPLQAAYDAVNGIVLEGCCQASGKCGYSTSFEGFGFGCVSPTRFGYDEGADCDYQP